MKPNNNKEKKIKVNMFIIVYEDGSFNQKLFNTKKIAKKYCLDDWLGEESKIIPCTITYKLK